MSKVYPILGKICEHLSVGVLGLEATQVKQLGTDFLTSAKLEQVLHELMFPVIGNAFVIVAEVEEVDRDLCVNRTLKESGSEGKDA
jgi:hypothetical protein